MMKLTKDIIGVPDGEIYPRAILRREECPENLMGYAESIGAMEAKPTKKEAEK